MRYGSRTKAVIKLVIRDAERKHLMLAAAGLAYYFLMSLFPALVLLTAGAAYLPLQNVLTGRGDSDSVGCCSAHPMLRNVVDKPSSTTIEAFPRVMQTSVEHFQILHSLN